MTKTKVFKPAPHRKLAYVWHKRVGLAASLLVVVIAVTGVALMHSDQLRLNERNMSSELILDWYGLEPQSAPLNYRVQTDWFSWLEGGLYFNGKLVAENVAQPRGAITHNSLMVFAGATEFLLFTMEGELVERIRALELLGEIIAIAADSNRHLLVLTSVGRFRSDPDMLNWKPTKLVFEPAEPSDAPPEIETAVLNNYRGQGLPWSRVLLDVHTGRILGNWGPYLMDAAALCLLILAGSGIYNWFSNRRT